jgi:ribosomal protein L32
MAVQQNKKSPSKRGMHRSHNALNGAWHRGRTHHR